MIPTRKNKQPKNSNIKELVNKQVDKENDNRKDPEESRIKNCGLKKNKATQERNMEKNPKDSRHHA